MPEKTTHLHLTYGVIQLRYLNQSRSAHGHLSLDRDIHIQYQHHIYSLASQNVHVFKVFLNSILPPTPPPILSNPIHPIFL